MEVDFDAYEMSDKDCHCPEPNPTEDGKKCKNCNGDNPTITKKKVRKKK